MATTKIYIKAQFAVTCKPQTSRMILGEDQVSENAKT